MLAVDQDTLGLQAVKAAEPVKGLEVWVKPLAKAGSRAVLLLNRTGTAQEISAGMKDLELAENASRRWSRISGRVNNWPARIVCRASAARGCRSAACAGHLSKCDRTAYRPDSLPRNSANAIAS